MLASAPDAVVADADELLDQGYAADEVQAVVAATQPATAAAARRRWEVDVDDEGPPLKSGMDRSATIARGLVRLFFGDGTMKGLARCAAAWWRRARRRLVSRAHLFRRRRGRGWIFRQHVCDVASNVET